MTCIVFIINITMAEENTLYEWHPHLAKMGVMIMNEAGYVYSIRSNKYHTHSDISHLSIILFGKSS